MIRSMCCLQLDLHDSPNEDGEMGSAELTGSIGVVTLNIKRASATSRVTRQASSQMDHLIDLAPQSLEDQA